MSLTLGGIAAAFGVASCCGLPIVLASLGIGSASLFSVAIAAAPYRQPLLAIGTLCLLGGALLLFRQQRTAWSCDTGKTCAPRSMRLATLVGLLIGGWLLWLGYHYV
jgi:mercuric ion transport protein